MLLKQYGFVCPANVSRLIAGRTTGAAVIVDLQRDADPYRHDVARHGCRIRYPFLTPLRVAIAAGVFSRHALNRLLDLMEGTAVRKAAGPHVIAATTI